jgi:phosphatidylglycerol---prolipoprotein diacylglyceryl transferase
MSSHTLNSAFTAGEYRERARYTPRMLDFLPNPVAFQLGPLTIGWYGLGYVVGLAVAYQILVRLARWAGENQTIVANGMIVVAIAALVGGRLYHVIDQWALYQDDLLKIVLPPYSGLGVYGGIAAGLIALVVYARRLRQSILRWADIVAPALFAMQAVARWGNFFNQELYGPPTTLPWGIPIDCTHRLIAYPCDAFPVETTRFHPLFLYESISGLIGAAVLIWLGFRLRSWLRAGDLALIFFIWYGVVRFGLETLREDNWLFFGIPTAQIVSLLFIVPAVALLIWRHRPGHPLDAPPSRPKFATWGAEGRPVEFGGYLGDDADLVDDDIDDIDDEFDEGDEEPGEDDEGDEEPGEDDEDLDGDDTDEGEPAVRT